MKRFDFLILLSLTVIFTSCSSKHILFVDGNSDYSIVVDPAAGESVQYAACELQRWISEVSGVSLPIVGLDGGQEGKRLIVGFNDIAAAVRPGAKVYEASDDSFTWCSAGGDIILWGGAKRGTLYSVYSFLEEELGVRWYTSKVSVAPKNDKYAFRVLDHSESPSLKVRDDLYLDVIANPDFSGKLRNNNVPLTGRDGNVIPYSAERFWGGHTFDVMVPPSVYMDSHPEYYSLRDGVREKGYTQLCLSNPDVLRITIENMRKYMRENPDYLIYSLTQNDNFHYCECPECQAIADQYGGQSGIMIWFVNQVADAIRDEFPDKYIGTFAYQYTRGVPEGIAPRENVVVRLCSIECCLLHDYDECGQNREFLDDLRGWAAIAPHLYIWDYTTAFTQYSLPVPNFKTAKTHIQDFVASKAIGMMEEGDYQTKCGEFNELKAYLFAKLMWNSEADPDAIIKDFTDGYYGPAGEYIREYIEFSDRILRREGIHMNCNPFFNHEAYTEEFILGSYDIFEKAKAAVADNPEYLSRVESAEFPILLLYNENISLEAYKLGIYDAIKHVVEKDGISRMAEYSNPEEKKSYINTDIYFARHDELCELFTGPDWPASGAECGEPGVAYKYYEGEFETTVEMLESGTLKEEGTMGSIAIPDDPAKDHFCYDFTGLFKAEEDGVYRFMMGSDDGAVLYIDGKEIINIDGSHDLQAGQGYAPLQAGPHNLRLVYYDDCNDQILNLKVESPSKETAEPVIYLPLQ